VAYLTVRCPRTNKLASPRVRIRTLEALCDHCGEWHEFDIATAVIVEDDD